MNRTTKIEILAYASNPSRDTNYEGDTVEYNGKKYFVSLENETVEYLGDVTSERND